jgi:hypothetical protein
MPVQPRCQHSIYQQLAIGWAEGSWSDRPCLRWVTLPGHSSIPYSNDAYATPWNSSLLPPALPVALPEGQQGRCLSNLGVSRVLSASGRAEASSPVHAYHPHQHPL